MTGAPKRGRRRTRAPGWVVVRVRPNLLRRALTNMRQQGFETYSPTARLRSPKTYKYTRGPLFPGYVFARHPERRWVSLSGTFGVLNILMGTGERPAYMPDAEIERLRAREDDQGIIQLEARKLAHGDKVHVTRGPLGTFDAVVDNMSGEERVFVFMELLGRYARVEVNVGDASYVG